MLLGANRRERSDRGRRNSITQGDEWRKGEAGRAGQLQAAPTWAGEAGGLGASPMKTLACREAARRRSRRGKRRQVRRGIVGWCSAGVSPLAFFANAPADFLHQPTPQALQCFLWFAAGRLGNTASRRANNQRDGWGKGPWRRGGRTINETAGGKRPAPEPGLPGFLQRSGLAWLPGLRGSAWVKGCSTWWAAWLLCADLVRLAAELACCALAWLLITGLVAAFSSWLPSARGCLAAQWLLNLVRAGLAWLRITGEVQRAAARGAGCSTWCLAWWLPGCDPWAGGCLQLVAAWLWVNRRFTLQWLLNLVRAGLAWLLITGLVAVGN